MQTMQSTLQSVRESLAQAESILADAHTLKADFSPFCDKVEYTRAMNSLKSQWSKEARRLSLLADSMMGVSTNG